jgi:hypothetical protein
MAFESEMTGGYPSSSDIDDFLAEIGIEKITFANPNYYDEFRKFIWGILKAVNWALALGVYCPTPATVNVRGGKYLFKDTVKTFTTGQAINPTDNDTTYIWMAADNTIGSAIDGTGWPTTEHIKLAEIDVDEDGIITDIRDLRGETLLQYLKNVTSHTGTSAEMLPIFWDKTTPAIDDEIRIPFYGRNSTGEKIEYGRLTIKLTAVADGTEAATLSFQNMVAGTLTILTFGDVTTSGSQVLTNKTIDAASNTISNLAGTQLANIGANGGIPFILTATLTAGNTVVIHNANAPFKYKVINVWGIPLTGDTGTFQVKNGTNAITDAIVVATANGFCWVTTIDHTYNVIDANGTLSVAGDGSLADVDVFIMCIRVA